MRRRGTLREDGEQTVLTFRRVYHHAPEHVWDAISTPEGLAGWLMCTHARIEGRVGGAFDLVAGPPQYPSTGTILTWDPPRVLEYEWHVAPVPEMPHGERAVFRYELTPQDGSTLVVVTCRGISRATVPGYLPGQHVFLDRLEAQLDGAPLPDWMARFAEVRAEYPEWSDHATDPAE